MNNTIKAAVLHGAGDLRIDDEPLDAGHLKPKELYVETQITALKLGTDRGNYEGEKSIPGAPNEFPRHVGDSNIGIVRKVGSEVTRFKVGDRIVSRTSHLSAFIADEDQTRQLVIFYRLSRALPRRSDRRRYAAGP